MSADNEATNTVTVPVYAELELSPNEHSFNMAAPDNTHVKYNTVNHQEFESITDPSTSRIVSYNE